MKRLIVVVLALVCAGSMMYAQDVRRSKNDLGMLFTLNGLGNLSGGAYNGGVGAQWYVADDMALRLGLGFASMKNEDKSGAVTRTETNTLVSVNPGFRLNLAHNSNVVGYAGVQAMIGMSSGKVEAGGTTELTGTTVGGGIFLGAEWFPWKNVSLGLEYGLGFMSSSSKTKIGSNETDGPTVTTIYLGAPVSANTGNGGGIVTNPISFNLSLYFN